MLELYIWNLGITMIMYRAMCYTRQLFSRTKERDKKRN